MCRLLSIILLFVVILVSLHGQIIGPGFVSGRWSLNKSPYLVHGDIMVHSDSTLIIDPGVKVIFQDNHCLTVRGHLTAIGTNAKDIIFTATADTTWGGISFFSGAIGSSIKYAKFERVINSVAITVYNTDYITIENCEFTMNYVNNTNIKFYSEIINASNSSFITFNNNTAIDYKVKCGAWVDSTTYVNFPRVITLASFSYCNNVSLNYNVITNNQLGCISVYQRILSLIYFNSCDIVTFTNNSITDNKVLQETDYLGEYVSTIYMHNCGYMVFNNNTLAGNDIILTGGAAPGVNSSHIYSKWCYGMSFNNNDVIDNNAYSIIILDNTEQSYPISDDFETEVRQNRIENNNYYRYALIAHNDVNNHFFYIEDNNISGNKGITSYNHGSCVSVADRNIIFNNNIVTQNIGNGDGCLKIEATADTLFIENNIICQNSAYSGGGVYIQVESLNTKIYFAENKIHLNTASHGGGVAVINGRANLNDNYFDINTGIYLVKNSIVHNNAKWGAGVSVRNSNVALVNNLVAYNYAITNYSGDGIFIIEGGSHPVTGPMNVMLINNILWANDGYEIMCSIESQDNLYIRNTVVQGGMSSIYSYATLDAINVYTADPQFKDPYSYDWHILNADYGSQYVGFGTPHPDYVGIFSYDPLIDAPTHTRNFTADWQWISFPMLNRDFNTNASVWFDTVANTFSMSASEILYQNDFASYVYNRWVNLGSSFDFQSTMGYKVNITQELNHSIQGTTLKPTVEITLQPEIENWIGYFLPETQNILDAFGIVTLKKLSSIKAKHGGVYIVYDTYPAISGKTPPLLLDENGNDITVWAMLSSFNLNISFGDMVAVRLNPDETSGYKFTWSRGQVVLPNMMPETRHFAFTKKADYCSLFIELEIENPPDEIGALINGVCKGATVYQGEISEIQLYLDDADLNEEVEIAFAYHNVRVPALVVGNFAVVNPRNHKLEYKPLIATPNTPFYRITFTNGNNEVAENITLPFIQLMQNYPNPFNPETKIDFYLSQDDNITLTIYNIKGQRVLDLLKGESLAGKHSVVWNGKDSTSSPVSSGIYFYRLTTTIGSVQRKMALIK